MTVNPVISDKSDKVNIQPAEKQQGLTLIAKVWDLTKDFQRPPQLKKLCEYVDKIKSELASILDQNEMVRLEKLFKQVSGDVLKNVDFTKTSELELGIKMIKAKIDEELKKLGQPVKKVFGILLNRRSGEAMGWALKLKSIHSFLLKAKKIVDKDHLDDFIKHFEEVIKTAPKITTLDDAESFNELFEKKLKEYLDLDTLYDERILDCLLVQLNSIKRVLESFTSISSELDAKKEQLLKEFDQFIKKEFEKPWDKFSKFESFLDSFDLLLKDIEIVKEKEAVQPKQEGVKVPSNNIAIETMRVMKLFSIHLFLSKANSILDKEHLEDFDKHFEEVFQRATPQTPEEFEAQDQLLEKKFKEYFKLETLSDELIIDHLLAGMKYGFDKVLYTMTPMPDELVAKKEEFLGKFEKFINKESEKSWDKFEELESFLNSFVTFLGEVEKARAAVAKEKADFEQKILTLVGTIQDVNADDLELFQENFLELRNIGLYLHLFQLYRNFLSNGDSVYFNNYTQKAVINFIEQNY